MTVNLKIIKVKRLERGYTMDQMAAKLGLTNGSMYSKRENGHYNFKAEELMMVSKILKIPFKQLFLSDSNSKMEIYEQII